MRPMPEYQARENKTRNRGANDHQRHAPFVLFQKRQRVVAVTDRQVTNAEVADQPRQADGGGEACQPHFKHSSSDNENLEGGLRWPKGSQQESEKTLLQQP